MKLLVTCLLAAAVFAAPCLYEASSSEPSPLAGLVAISQNYESATPTPVMVAVREADMQSEMASVPNNPMRMMVMDVVAMVVTMFSTGSTLAASVAFNVWSGKRPIR